MNALRGLCLALLVLLSVTAPAFADDTEYAYKYMDKLTLSSMGPGASGNAILSFNCFVPVPKTAGEKFPALLFPNSWACNQYEYQVQAKEFAKHGYVVLSYSTRGWGGSTGMVEVGGEGDMADVSHLIDWLIEKTPTDPKRIGMAGISYGAGISLLGAAHDPRIKAVAAMSGWASLFVSLDMNGTPSALWTKVLVLAAEATHGHLSPFMSGYVKAAQTYVITDEMRAAAMTRSPVTYLDAYNNRQVAILMSNNFQDDLFSAADAWRFYSRLKSPKFMMLNQGQHAYAEESGLKGKPSYVWDHVHTFMDRYVKGVPGAPIAMVNGLSMMQAYKYTDYFAIDPSNPMQVGDLSYGLAKGTNPATGALAPMSTAPFATPLDVNLKGGLTAATSGTPPSAILEILELNNLTLPWVTLDKVDRRNAAVFLSAPLTAPMRVRGIPHATMTVSVTGTGSTSGNIAAQIIAYLYDVDQKGVGNLISFGPLTLFGDPPENLVVKLPMRITAVDLAAGHRLGLVLGTEDPLYGLKASVWRHDTLTIHNVQGSSGTAASIVVPVLK